MWTIHPLECRNVTVQGVTVDNLGPNGDGCDPESCTDVLIRGCTFRTHDDCIAIKSGRDADGPEAAPEQTMELSYDRHPTSLHVTVRARAPEGWPGRDELGWAMLGSLVGQIRVQVEDGIGTLTLIQPLPTGADR